MPLHRQSYSPGGANVHCVYVGVVVQSQEALKLTKVSRDNARRHEVTERAQKQVDSFTRQVERRLSEKMELTAENKEAYIRALQHRCHQHVRTPTWCLFRGSDSTGAALTQPASVSALLSAGGGSALKQGGLHTCRTATLPPARTYAYPRTLALRYCFQAELSSRQ